MEAQRRASSGPSPHEIDPSSTVPSVCSYLLHAHLSLISFMAIMALSMAIIALSPRVSRGTPSPTKHSPHSPGVIGCGAAWALFVGVIGCGAAWALFVGVIGCGAAWAMFCFRLLCVFQCLANRVDSGCSVSQIFHFYSLPPPPRSRQLPITWCHFPHIREETDSQPKPGRP